MPSSTTGARVLPVYLELISTFDDAPGEAVVFTELADFVAGRLSTLEAERLVLERALGAIEMAADTEAGESADLVGYAFLDSLSHLTTNGSGHGWVLGPDLYSTRSMADRAPRACSPMARDHPAEARPRDVARDHPAETRPGMRPASFGCAWDLASLSCTWIPLASAAHRGSSRSRPTGSATDCLFCLIGTSPLKVTDAAGDGHRQAVRRYVQTAAGRYLLRQRFGELAHALLAIPKQFARTRTENNRRRMANRQHFQPQIGSRNDEPAVIVPQILTKSGTLKVPGPQSHPGGQGWTR